MVRSPSQTLEKVGADLVYRISAMPLYKKAFKYWYPFMTRRMGHDDVVFLNWGYEEDPPLGLKLEAADETDRYSIQLYHQTASQIDLTGKKVLEVSSGHGGGASFIARTLKPASYTGLDFNPDGVAFCQKRHQVPGLDFVQGDALNLPFPDNSFDAVVNVEASHIYPDFAQFVREVGRVLRPGGHFLHTDFRAKEDIESWQQTLATPPLRLVNERDISREVVRGLAANSPRSNDLINERMPFFLRRFAREFAVVEGSLFYRDLDRGEITYRIFDLVKD
ncbi:phthiotriol/phenolphthiotriol dimycocerosates methyltransferase [Mycolicibacter terrae]|jgi:SAM-dependent methyltransferase|uniref:Phthiotriol/phenolphthiotriol dimycocerosates methyltransferase n=2 Tax=Mycolicibacter terrae TaxID=1788 RepID=A0AAD1HVY8_9MYCO|nr:phthiotriol/phenolphthiotriol dimycocerosates methyltransferase [Mycolicibacter terrae]SNV74553.1 methyltransferase [Mycolicibacter terrae]